MVLYHADGTAVQAHEDYLERQARAHATEYQYPNQINVYNKRKGAQSTANVQIIIDRQKYRTLYCENGGDSETLRDFRQATKHKILPAVDRQTLMACSTFAQEHFTYNPESNELHLPACHPRTHEFGLGKYDPNKHGPNPKSRMTEESDGQMAFIRSKEIEDYILPWLKRVQPQLKKAKAPRSESPREPTTVPKRTKLARYLVSQSDSRIAMGIPDALVDKIHLYNAMLQLGLPKFVQLPLIDALVLQMHQTELDECELDTLEHTVGRFYSKSVAVLDPVLNHFIGTYPFRSLGDRTNPEPANRSARLADDADDTASEQTEGTSEEASVEPETTDATSEEKTNSTPEEADNNEIAKGTLEEASVEPEATDATSEEQISSTPEEANDDEPKPDSKAWKKKRKYLEYCNVPANRQDYMHDTYIQPPELAVLGHSIRHWSDVRQNQSTAAAHTGFPLAIGKYKKFIRRNSTDAIDVEDRYEEETNRLAHQLDYQKKKAREKTDNKRGLVKKDEEVSMRV